jgi:cell division protein FtsW
LGAGAVVFLFTCFILRGLKVAAAAGRGEGGYFQALLAAGVTGLIGFQALVNLGVATGLLPTKGIPLPLVSYGGSSMVFTLMGIGLLFNVSRGTKISSSVARSPSHAFDPG